MKNSSDDSGHEKAGESTAAEKNMCQNTNLGDLLNDYIQGSLTENQKDLFLEHLTICVYCQDALEEELSIMSIVATVKRIDDLRNNHLLRQSAAG